MSMSKSSAPTRKVLAVLEDLFFTVKINEAAKRAGLPVQFVKSERDALDAAAEQPAVVVIDLNCTCLDPLQLIRSIKAKPELSSISLVGYVSHVQGELKLQAQQAGCDMVLARSAFSQNLPQILKRHSEAHAGTI
jgi:CheY-like chemotaxis protein